MFKTKDFYLASTLLMSGCKIKYHEKEGNKTIFYFADSEELRVLVDDYFYDRIRVSPHLFQSSIKTLKALMYD
jgi:hypothetical protein